jgi:hypothetical protein
MQNMPLKPDWHSVFDVMPQAGVERKEKCLLYNGWYLPLEK